MIRTFRLIAISMLLAHALPAIAQEAPKAADPLIVVELVAAQPDIVHPISCDFDHKGRLLVIESHTHFAPQGYKGPKHDRIQAFDVSKPGSKPTTFFEGTRHTMDLAVHPNGAVYLATRNEILRLRETADGVKSERIVFLDTKGDYPHNGLSGLCFDSKGDLYFGMGENLGAAYKLIGSDGASFSGQGDGGHIFHCTADGKKLRRVATGFWNPFGNCRDIYGRLFCVDNDPDQAPPCRMLHVVEGGDYGFRFMYGRSGKHPFQSWHGELPGTLPMMTGVGEAPCEILSYESDGLPKEYLGQLLVTSWADHRVERYKVVPHGASFKAERMPFVQGPSDFRPVGMCIAPDGSLYITDWVKSDYTLHGKGAIWHVRWKDAPKVERPSEPEKAILSMHRPLREWAAKKLTNDERGWKSLCDRVERGDVRVRAAALAALADEEVLLIRPDLVEIAKSDPELGMRELSVRTLVKRNAKTELPDFLDRKVAGAVQTEILRGISIRVVPKLDYLLVDNDPFFRHAAIEAISKRLGFLEPELEKLSQSDRRVAVFLARRLGSSGNAASNASSVASAGLTDSDEMIRFLAVKWVADEKFANCRKDVERMMDDPKLSVRMYLACATALARLDGRDVNEKSLADYFAKRLEDDKTPAALRTQLLKQVPTAHAKLSIDLLVKLLESKDDALRFEAVRALVDHPNPRRHVPLLEIFRNPKESVDLRAYATLGLTERTQEWALEMHAIATDKKSPLRDDAARAMMDVKIEGARFLRSPIMGRPPAKDIDAWMKRLDGPADADAGARVFFHTKLAGCAKCHRIDGRGADVGQDLSGIGRTDRRHILESILQPSNTVAPHYQVWHIETNDGKVRNGMLIHTQLDEYTFLDAQGGRFKLKTGDIAEQRAVTTSIMPDGLHERMTDQELRDLLAYLQTRK